MKPFRLVYVNSKGHVCCVVIVMAAVEDWAVKKFEETRQYELVLQRKLTLDKVELATEDILAITHMHALVSLPKIPGEE